jgi:hypothetical protein
MKEEKCFTETPATRTDGVPTVDPALANIERIVRRALPRVPLVVTDHTTKEEFEEELRYLRSQGVI